MNRMLSIIIPVYNEEESIPDLLKCLKTNINNLLKKETINKYEIIFISDGSTDGSEEIIKKQIKQDFFFSSY